MILYNFFHDFIHVYIPREGADNSLGKKFNVNRNLLSLQSYVASFKKSPWSLTLYNKCVH